MLKHLVDAAQRIFENAADLYSEALALRDLGALSRALFLHRISLEKCAKIEMLGAWGTSVLMGHEPDLKKLMRAFASHKAKNYTNAYFLPVGETEANARRDKRWEDALAAFKAAQDQFHYESNSAKNAALYVDIEEGRSTAPKDRTNETMVVEIRGANEYWLSLVEPKVEMMQRWLHHPDEVRELFAGFEDRMEELRKADGDPETAFGTLMEELLARANAIGYADDFRRAKE